MVSFFQSSRYVCTGSGGGQLLLWELRTRDVARSFRGHERRVNCLAFSHNEAQLASASGAGGGVLLHSTLSGQESTRLPQAGTVSALAFSRFRLAWLAAADEDGSVLLWDANTRTPAATFARLHAAPASAVAFSPSARLLLACAGLDARLHLLDLALKRPLRSLALEAPVHSLAFSEDGHLLAAGLANGTARPHRRRISLTHRVQATSPSWTCGRAPTPRTPFRPTRPTWWPACAFSLPGRPLPWSRCLPSSRSLLSRTSLNVSATGRHASRR